MAVLVIGLPLTALLLSHLGSVVGEGGEAVDQDAEVVVHRHAQNESHKESEAVPRMGWKQKFLSYQRFVVSMLPATAIKIVVTVWQIISQVRDHFPCMYYQRMLE